MGNIYSLPQRKKRRSRMTGAWALHLTCLFQVYTLDIPVYSKDTYIMGESIMGERKDTRRNNNPITTLARGPTTAITISLLGVSGSFSIFDTPPNRYNSISDTINPYFCATQECISSCIKIDRRIITTTIVIPRKSQSLIIFFFCFVCFSSGFIESSP